MRLSTKASEHSRYAMIRKGQPKKALWVTLDVWVMVEYYAHAQGLTIQEATQDLIGMGLTTAWVFEVKGKIR